MRNLLLLPVLVVPVVIAALACGSSQTKSQPPAASAAAPPAQPAGRQMCPMMATAGASVVASDTSDGVAIAFTTSGDVAALRSHVRQMAEMHNGMTDMHHDGGGMGSGAMHGGMGSGAMHGGMMHGGMMHGQIVPSHASMEEIPGGARIVLVPTDPSQLSTLREQAREHAAMIARGECPMMQQHAQSNDEHAQPHPPGN